MRLRTAELRGPRIAVLPSGETGAAGPECRDMEAVGRKRFGGVVAEKNRARPSVQRAERARSRP